MKSNSTSRVTEALAILKESAEEFTLREKPKRGGVSKTEKIKEVKKRSRK
jgi:ribosomal protein L29